MAIEAAKQERAEENKVLKALPESEGIVLEADYAEDRPMELLAERQRAFQKTLRGQYVDTELPTG